MSSLAKTSSWQRDRAARLHEAFVRLQASMELENAPLVKSLQTLSARLDGTPLTGGKVLKVSWQNLRTLYYKWEKGGRKATALLSKHGSPAHIVRLPDELAAEIQKLATTKTGARDKNGNGIEAPAIRQKLQSRWWAGEALPGIGTWQDWWRANHPALPLPVNPPEFPWCDRTIYRKMGPKALRRMGNIGHAAALKHMPSMKRDYSKLRKCELYTLDDVKLDLVALCELTGKPVDVVIYILIEVASRSIVSFVLKPKNSIRAEDVDEMIAHGLQADGFGIGVGYPTHIWFERGTVACSEAAQRVLEAGSDGGIVIHRTSMDGGVSWIGSAADKASGHSAGKAVIESFNRNLHRALLHLPGQRGNNYANMPANLGAGDPNLKDASRSERGTLVAEAEKLAQFKRTAMLLGHTADLKLPLLTISQLQQEVRKVMQDHNDRRGHDFQGFHQVTEAEVAPGVWQQISDR
jgi:hypothetical protein